MLNFSNGAVKTEDCTMKYHSNPKNRFDDKIKQPASRITVERNILFLTDVLSHTNVKKVQLLRSRLKKTQNMKL